VPKGLLFVGQSAKHWPFKGSYLSAQLADCCFLENTTFDINAPLVHVEKFDEPVQKNGHKDGLTVE
jgi:hypothetical protein